MVENLASTSTAVTARDHLVALLADGGDGEVVALEDVPERFGLEPAHAEIVRDRGGHLTSFVLRRPRWAG